MWFGVITYLRGFDLAQLESSLRERQELGWADDFCGEDLEDLEHFACM